MKVKSALIALLTVLLSFVIFTSCATTITYLPPQIPTYTPDSSFVQGDSSVEDSSVVDSSVEDSSVTDSSVTDSSVDDSSAGDDNPPDYEIEIPAISAPAFSMSSIPAFSDSIVYELNGGTPYFYTNQITTESYEYYSELDSLGRCGVAVACIGLDIMPQEGDSRGSISSVTPTGWQSGFYERSHLLAWQLTCENANRQNLISGTYMFNSAMQIYEEEVATYIKSTSKHVLYRVTPIFEGNNLLASGVILEALSVEDNGASICMNLFIYNAQTDYTINYADGTYTLNDDAEINNYAFVINKNNGKIHKADCSSVLDMKESNKIYSNDTIEELLNQGYVKAGCCW